MYSRGSEWRRWDLHVHTPGTLLSDQFGNAWEPYLAAIEASSVAVIGVTDYFTVRSYQRMKEYRDGGRLANVALLIPNIEFRISPMTVKGKAVNIHLLISPDDPDHISEIEHALSYLVFEDALENKYRCTLDGLCKLGRSINGESLPENSAIEVGANQFKVEFGSFKQWFEGQAWLKRNSIVVVAAGDDGLAGLRKDSGWQAVHERLAKFAQAIFTASPTELSFWRGLTGKKKADELLLKLGGPKPCIHGSDAHKLSRLFEPDHQRYCWIKADPSFEGLRQILFEPVDRVAIGPSSPVIGLSKANVISSIRIGNSDGWFAEEPIPVNPGLVAIVGKKGSGKSALAELTAAAGGQLAAKNDDRSFIKRAKGYLKETVVEVTWEDGTVTSQPLRGATASSEPKVRYLSQSFVEGLCGPDGGASSLTNEIESIVFAHLDPTERLDVSGFDELRRVRVERVARRRQEVQARIDGSTRSTQVIHERRLTLDEKKAQKAALDEEQKALNTQAAEGATEAETKFAEDLSKLQEALGAAQKTASAMKRNLVSLENVKSRLEEFRRDGARFFADVSISLRGLGFGEDTIAAFEPKFFGDPDKAIEERFAHLTAEIATVEGGSEPAPPGTIKAIMAELAVLSGKQSDDQARRSLIQAAQARLSEIRAQTQRLEAEIAQIESGDMAALESARQDRMEAYLEHFDLLAEEARILDGLYKPVRERLLNGRGNEKLLEFEIRRCVDVESWIERGEELTNIRRPLDFGSIKRFEDLAAYAREKLAPAWESGDRELIRAAFGDLLTEIRCRPPGEATFLKKNRTYADFMAWLHEVRHIKLEYGLLYQKTPLDKLSPGTKGIVLLILYLAMVHQERRPLIVDQPEENLDNESIFSELSFYFREAKKNRQIILITHNPNLVVNTDAEQVIIADCTRGAGGLPSMSYVSGSLENAHPSDRDIRGRVCKILEGGAEAFKKRDERYRLNHH